MSHHMGPCIRLQDGTACNLDRRIAKHARPLVECLRELPDPRNPRGKRHSLGLVVFVIVASLLRGGSNLVDAHLYAAMNARFLRRLFDMPHGVPDPTTISRVLQVVDPAVIVTATTRFATTLGVPLGEALSFDGKTIRALAGTDQTSHILSLFSHTTHVALGQIGVDAKENEIPAFLRLLEQTADSPVPVAGKLLLGDALHTQRATAAAIVEAGADYLLVVKGNQRNLGKEIQARLRYQPTKRCSTTETGRKRRIRTTVTVTSSDNDLMLAAGASSPGCYWKGVRTAGRLTRTGTRTSKTGVVRTVNETVYFISSRKLTPKQAGQTLRAHWCIENNLHWVKDVVFGEDRHTLRKGNAPQLMSWLRSFVISICNLIGVGSISRTLSTLGQSPVLLTKFMRMAMII